MNLAMEVVKAQIAALNGVAYPGVKINLGQLEQVFTGLGQVFLIIAIILFVLGVLMIFFPGLRRFIGDIV